MALDTTLRLLARSSGLSAADLAAAIPRVGAAAVRAWMAGEPLPGREHLIVLARTLGIPAGALLSELATQLDPARTRGEADLLTAYRSLSPRQRGALIEIARDMADSRLRRRRTAAKDSP